MTRRFHTSDSSRSCLFSGSYLNPGDCLRSTYNLFSFCYTFQGGGVIKRVENNSTTWTGFAGVNNPDHLILQNDGNLVAYNKSGKPYWATNSFVRGTNALIMQNDGNLVLYNNRSVSLWGCSNRSPPCPTYPLPSSTPTLSPSMGPAGLCSNFPTYQPTKSPTYQPTSQPTRQPSTQPSSFPTYHISATIKNSLVGYYPFNGNVLDKSGNNNHGTVPSGSAYYMVDRFQNQKSSYAFVNSNYITLPGNPFDFLQNLSISFWVYPLAGHSWATLFDKSRLENPTLVTGGFFLSQYANMTNKFFFGHVDAETGLVIMNNKSEISLTTSAWNHVSIVKDMKSIRYYLNSALVKTRYFPPGNSGRIKSNKNLPLNIGATVSGTGTVSFPFSGVLDDLFIFNRTLSVNEIQQLYSFDAPTSQPSTQPTSQPSSQPTLRIQSTLKKGLVAFYPFDGDAHDHSGNGNNGVMRNVYPTKDRFGNSRGAFDFDGLYSYISVDSTQFNFISNLTISVWVKPNSLRPASTIVDKGALSELGEFALSRHSLSSNAFVFSYIPNNMGPSMEAVVPYNVKEWNHIVVTKSDSAVSVYANGELINAYAVSNAVILDSDAYLCIGASGCDMFSALNVFNGSIDDLFFYNRALSPVEIALLYSFDSPTSQPTVQPSVRISNPIRNGLVAFYPFDGNPNDKSGNGYNGVITGNVSLVADRFGNARSAYQFDGSTGMISTPVAPFNFESNMTVALWVITRPQISLGALCGTLKSEASGFGGYALYGYLKDNLQNFKLRYSTGTFTTASQPFSMSYPSPQDWMHLAFVKSGSSFAIYRNGVAIQQILLTTTKFVKTANVMEFTIGGIKPSGFLSQQFNGILDDIFVFNRSLSSSEIMSLYSFDAPTSQPSSQPTSQPTMRVDSILKDGLIAFYPFNGDAHDHSGNGNNGVMHYVFATEGRFGNRDGALMFDGSTSFISVDSHQFNFVSNLTISVWVKPANYDLMPAVIVDKGGSSGARDFYISVDELNPQMLVFGYVGQHDYVPFEYTIPYYPGDWNHVVVTKTDLNVTLYLNGEIMSVTPLTNPFFQSSEDPLCIGASWCGTPSPVNYFTGSIDDLFIFNRALPLDEVKLLYVFDSPTSMPTNQPSSQPTVQPSVRISNPIRNGLVAFYPFDGNPNDKSGNGNNGVITGNVALVADRFGNARSAYQFDGQSLITVKGTSFNFQSNMTLALWAKLLPNAQYGALISKLVPAGFARGYGIFATLQGDVNMFMLKYGLGGRFQNPQYNSLNPAPNDWMHLAFVKKSNSYITYRNGVIISNLTLLSSTFILLANTVLTIGGTTLFGQVASGFIGFLDDIFIYDRCLSSSEIMTLYSFDAPTSQPSSGPSQSPTNQPSALPSSLPTAQPSNHPSAQPTQQPSFRFSDTLSTGLVAYYPLDYDARDHSGNGNHGQCAFGTAFTLDRFNVRNMVVNIGVPNSYITIPAGNAFNFNGVMTIAFWIYFRNSFQNSTIIDKSSFYSTDPSSYNGGFNVHYISESAIALTLISKISRRKQSNAGGSAQIQPKKWYHVAIVLNGTHSLIYHNAYAKSIRKLTTTIIVSNGKDPLIIGGRNLNGTVSSFFSGYLDDIFFYNRSLSANEIGRLYSFDAPTSQPSMQPTSRPSSRPSGLPSMQPTIRPSALPTIQPSARPSTQPTSVPSALPTNQPAAKPTSFPSCYPSALPTTLPSIRPYSAPSSQPSGTPSNPPTGQPSSQPSTYPSIQPTSSPSCQPSGRPSSLPTNQPSSVPTGQPSSEPTMLPSVCPSSSPSGCPSSEPSLVPSSQPTGCPSCLPSSFPSGTPTGVPTIQPSQQPTSLPTTLPSAFPTAQPTTMPSTSHPTTIPSSPPTSLPSGIPSTQPTGFPSTLPTSAPTNIPTRNPTGQPSNRPSSRPSALPSAQPTNFPTNSPTGHPSCQPSVIPSSLPSSQPTGTPSRQPTTQPSSQPSGQPTMQPSSQPLSFPTTRPTATPTLKIWTAVPSLEPSPSGPTPQIPTLIPSYRPSFAPTSTISILPSSRRFSGWMFLFGSTPASSQANNPVSNIYLTTNFVGKSFVLFGKQNRSSDVIVADLSSLASEGLMEVSDGGVIMDTQSRSTTMIGDVNNDGKEDLLIGDPMNSRAFLFFGSSSTMMNLRVSMMILENDESSSSPSIKNGLGWASAGLGDMNKDEYDDFIVTAPMANVAYVIFGRATRNFPNQWILSKMNSRQGFKILGSVKDRSFGMSVSCAGDFNRDGHRDIVISALRSSSSSQAMIYVLLGNGSDSSPVTPSPRVVSLDTLTNSSFYKILTPKLAFMGLSVAGLGDINGDGFDDISISSAPYQSGSYGEQQGFVAFGKDWSKTGSSNSLSLITRRTGIEDGFFIKGAGFMMTGLGDVNGDGLDDLMITNYEGWLGKGNAYLTIFPTNITSFPSMVPSLSPSRSSESPSSLPSAEPSLATRSPAIFPPNLAATARPSRRTATPTTPIPTNRPIHPSLAPSQSLSPSMAPTSLRPTQRPTSHQPSLAPSAARSKKPVQYPTSWPSTAFPTEGSTPTGSSSDGLITIEITTPGEFNPPNGQKNLIIAVNGSLHIGPSTGRTIYTIQRSHSRLPSMIYIESFRDAYDQLDLSAFREYHHLTEIPRESDPLTFWIAPDEAVVLLSHSSFDLSSKSFIFASSSSSSSSSSTSANVKNAAALGVIIVFTFMIIAMGIGVLSFYYRDTLRSLLGLPPLEQTSKGKGKDKKGKATIKVSPVRSNQTQLLVEDLEEGFVAPPPLSIHSNPKKDSGRSPALPASSSSSSEYDDDNQDDVEANGEIAFSFPPPAVIDTTIIEIRDDPLAVSDPSKELVLEDEEDDDDWSFSEEEIEEDEEDALNDERSHNASSPRPGIMTRRQSYLADEEEEEEEKNSLEREESSDSQENSYKEDDEDDDDDENTTNHDHDDGAEEAHNRKEYSSSSSNSSLD